jgi:hypothetical protein
MTNKTKEYIYIDDSGDPGFKTDGGSSKYLVIAAVVFTDSLIAEEVSLEMKKFRRSIRWTDDREFKFHQTKKSYIKDLLKIVNKYDFEIYSISVDKTKIKQPANQKTFYYEVIAGLLKNIPVKSADAVIDGGQGINYLKSVRAYLRQESNLYGKKIAKISFANSQNTMLVQLADLVAGSIFRSHRTNKVDSKDFEMIFKKHLTEIDFDY